MARRIKISSGVLNIAAHPHSVELYASLIGDIYALRRPLKMRGDRYGMISLLDRSDSEQGIVTGVLTTFLNIEFDGTWFDAVDLKEASNEQVSRVNIPENLHPNANSFYFYFDLKSHKLFFQNYSDGNVLTPLSAWTLFDGFSKQMEIIEKYGNVKVTLVQSKDSLERMFRLPVIKEITITIKKPNADIFSDDFEEKIEDHLAQSHSQQMSVIYQAEPGRSIEPTDEMRALGKVALVNGFVRVKGRNDTGAVNKSSERQPEIIQDQYDPEDEGESQAFRRLVSRDD